MGKSTEYGSKEIYLLRIFDKAKKPKKSQEFTTHFDPLLNPKPYTTPGFARVHLFVLETNAIQTVRHAETCN